MNRAEIGCGVGFDRDGRLMRDVDVKMSQILERASHRFGGATLIPIQGGWVNGSKVYVREAGYILRIDNVPEAVLPDVRAFALWVKAFLNQESVLMSVSVVVSAFL